MPRGDETAFEEKQHHDATTGLHGWMLDPQVQREIAAGIFRDSRVRSLMEAAYRAGHRQGGHMMLMHVLTLGVPRVGTFSDEGGGI